MPATEKQIQANRKNAQKSTGPKTKEGKLKIGQNNTKHGLFSPDLIINSPALKESPEDYRRLFTSLFEELSPVGLFEEQLVLKIVNCLWRSQRAARAETAEIQTQLEKIDFAVNSHFQLKRFMASGDKEDDPKEAERARANITIAQTIPAKRACLNILRYEMRLDRQFSRFYKILTQCQAIRKSREQKKIESDYKQGKVFQRPAKRGESNN